MRVFLPALALVGLVACGGGTSPSPVSPTPASPSASQVVVSLDTPIAVTKTTQATATATLTNGQTQAVTTGFRSDNPSVANVTDSGLVTGVSNGLANIYVVFGGMQGTRQVRVVPNYQGQWAGRVQLRNCTQTGIFFEMEFCSMLPGGSSWPVTLDMNLAGESVSGRFTVDDLPFPSFTASIEGDGAMTVSGTYTEADEGVELRLDAALRVNSSQDGRITGTHTQIWRLSGFNGEGRIEADIVEMTRAAGPGLSIRSGPSLRSVMRTVKRPRS